LGGQIVDYTNRRVLYTIQWWRRTFAVDPTRVYAFGISLGGACSMRLALTHPELIVAAMSIVGKADFSFESDPDTASAFNTGKYYRHQLEKLWGSTAADLASAEGPPIYTMVNDGALAARMAAQGDAFILNVSGRHDTIIGWAEKLGYFAGMEASHHGFMEFWDTRDHANQIYPAAMSPMSNPAYLYRFRSDLSWPAFSRCSADADPGDGTPAMGDTLGTINGFMEWDPGVTETPTSWGVTLLTRPVTTLWGTLPAPALLTVDVTPRRAQQFRPAPGRLVHWTATR